MAKIAVACIVLSTICLTVVLFGKEMNIPAEVAVWFALAFLFLAPTGGYCLGYLRGATREDRQFEEMRQIAVEALQQRDAAWRRL